MASPQRVYIDSCVFLSVLLDEGHSRDALSALDTLQNESYLSVISPLVIGEVYGAPVVRSDTGPGLSPSQARKKAQRAIDRVDATFEAFENWEGAAVIENTRRQAVMVRDLGFRLQLKGPDAMHLAAAIEAECDLLLTLDNDLLKVTQEQGVRIVRPSDLLSLGRRRPLRVVKSPDLEGHEHIPGLSV